MVDFKLKSLDIENFKGIRSLHIDFADGMTNIYGENGTGKTTIYDALTWLLFGKDSSGSANFSVKPTNLQGVTPTVTGIFLVNGHPLKLRKVLKERWSKPRGGVAKYNGDTVEHTVDDVPKKEFEYKAKIAEIVNEELFCLLTDVHRFAEKMSWKERRSQLAEISGLPEDTVLLAGAPQFALLAEALGRRSVDEYKAVLLAERKGANKTLDSLPIRIDECERRVSELAGLDYEAAEAGKAALMEQRHAVQTDLAKLDGNALLAETEARYKGLLAERKTLEAENNTHRNSQVVPLVDERPAMRADLTRLEMQMDNIQAEISHAQTAITQGELRLDVYREQWKEIDRHMFKEKACTTCGQPLPADQMEQAKARFEADKQRRKNNLLQDSDLLKESMQQAKEAMEQQNAELERKTGERDALAAKIAVYQPPEVPGIENLPDYETRKCALDLQLEEAAARVNSLRDGQTQERVRLMDKLHELDGQLTPLEQVLASKALLDETRARVAELTAEQRTCAAKLEELDRNIELCEAFTRYKVQFLTDAVNSRFQLARFRLFREQLNGGLADCCDVMVDGVPYADLNNAMQINVGLDIIATLSEHYGFRVPLVVDNAESVTKLQEIDTQVIRLVVSEHVKELKVV